MIVNKFAIQRITIKYNFFLGINLLTFIFSPSLSNSQDSTFVAPDVNIISVSPVQGAGIDLKRVPSNVQTFSESVLSEKKFWNVKYWYIINFSFP